MHSAGGGIVVTVIDVFSLIFAGAPLWAWAIFAGLVFGLVAFDLGILHRSAREIGVRDSLMLSAVYVALALLFGAAVWWGKGASAGTDWLTAYAVEKALAMDNVFVIAMIFAAFAVPRLHQHRVLFWGILGVVVLRAILIALGTTIVAEFAWMLLVFAVLLLVTGIKMLLVDDEGGGFVERRLLGLLRRVIPVADGDHGPRFLVRSPDPASGRTRLMATPLLLALVAIELADVIFAVDSVPAVFAITTDPFVVYTSNIFAVLGLRALYFALAAMLHRFRRLKTALALILVFIGAKVIAAETFGFHVVPAPASLAVTLGLLAGGILWSLWTTRAETTPRPDAR